MGTSNENTNKIYLTTFQGNMVRRVVKGTPDAKMRVTKKGDEVYELQFDTLTGYLDNIRLDDPPEKHPEFGKSWVFVIEDGDELFELKLSAKSREAHAFLARLPLVDFSQPVKVKTYWIKGDDDIYRNFLAVHQGGEKIEPWFTRDEPHGMPDLKKTIVDDVVHWDGSKRREFLLKLVNEKILPKIRAERPLSEATVEPVVVDDTDLPDDGDDPPPPSEDDVPIETDLPF